MLKADESGKEFWWLDPVRDSVWKGKYPTAFRVLDSIIFNQDAFVQQGLPLYVDNDRQYALLYKVNLLLSLRRTHEALAWLCLENTLHPENTSATALKEELLQKLPKTKVVRKPVPAANRLSMGWDGVAGMEEVKLRFERDIILPLKHPEIYAEYKLSPPNGILMWGPPGCGKTFLASALASRLNHKFIQINPSDTASIYIHGTVQKIAQVFDEAEANAPAIVFIDELDAFTPQRDGVQHSYAEEVNQLLMRLNNCSERGITVIGATNIPDRIDSAIKRPGRFDVLIYVSPPDMAAREQLFRIHLEGRKLAYDIDIMDLAMMTGGYTCSDIKHLCDEAARNALSRDESINHQHIVTAIQSNSPSVSSEELLKYEQLRENER